jgi:hypothetical protein
LVISEGRIWYVFDDVLAREIMWCKSILHTLFLEDFFSDWGVQFKIGLFGVCLIIHKVQKLIFFLFFFINFDFNFV